MGGWAGIVRYAVHMAAALAGCRKVLMALLCLCWGSISGTVGSFSVRRKCLLIGEPDYCRLLMSGCGQGHEPKGKNPWLKFPVQLKSEGMVHTRYP